ncbi:hypothetical protein HHI36_000718, partial [Cryptolaemus montrouzieri]
YTMRIKLPSSVMTETPVRVPDAVDVENSTPLVSSRPLTSQKSKSRREKRIHNTPKRPSERYYRMGSGSFDDENDVALQVKRTASKQLIPIPAKNNEKTSKYKRKTIIYRGPSVTYLIEIK